MEGVGMQVMGDAEKQCDQELIPPLADAAGSLVEKPIFHLIDFWEMLSELRL